MSKAVRRLGPRWPRKLKREAPDRALFAQAMREELAADMQSWLDGLALHILPPKPDPVLFYEPLRVRWLGLLPTKPLFIARITLPVT